MNLMRTQYADRVVIRAKQEIERKNFELAWRYLEEAHIFSQPNAGVHLEVHWEMFKLALREKLIFEVFGQLIRLILAIPSSVFRAYPAGNNGRSNVGLFTSVSLSKRHDKKMKELENLERRRIEDGGTLKKKPRQHPLTRE